MSVSGFLATSHVHQAGGLEHFRTFQTSVEMPLQQAFDKLTERFRVVVPVGKILLPECSLHLGHDAPSLRVWSIGYPFLERLHAMGEAGRWLAVFLHEAFGMAAEGRAPVE